MLLATTSLGCVYRADHGVAARMERAMAKVDVPSGEPRRLVYRQTGDAGGWTHEVIVSRRGYAERRIADDGTRYAFGVDGRGAWLAVQDRPVVVVDDSTWAWQAHTASSLAQLRFARPAEGDTREMLGRYATGWEVAFRPGEGNTMVLQLDGAQSLPFAIDTFDPWARLATCADLAWMASEDGMILERANCGSSNLGDRDTAQPHRVTRKLDEAYSIQTVPPWAHPRERTDRPRFSVSRFPITDEHRIEVPVRFGDGPARNIVLDTGAFHTTIDEELARSSGVVPTGEAPLFVNAPYVGKGDAWVGVADRLQVGDVVVHGPRVLVTDKLGNVDGLLGRDFFAHVVLDVNTPDHEVAMWDRARFDAEGMKRLRLRRGRARVEVEDVVAGEMLFDTGMPDNMVVHHWRMSVKHPRRRGDEVFLSAQDRMTSPEYATEIKGLTIGPFDLPRMPAVGRDREREELGGGIGILGMGVMKHFRLAFDMRNGWVLVEPGPSFHALTRAGIEIDDGALGPTVSRVVRWSPAEQADVQAGDVLLSMDGRRLSDAKTMRAHVAKHRGPFLRLTVSRREHAMARTVVLGARAR